MDDRKTCQKPRVISLKIARYFARATDGDQPAPAGLHHFSELPDRCWCLPACSRPLRNITKNGAYCSEEGCVRGAFSVCGISADRRVSLRRREFPLSAFSFFPPATQGLATHGRLDERSLPLGGERHPAPAPRDLAPNSRALGLVGPFGLTTWLASGVRSIASRQGWNPADQFINCP